MSVRTINAKLEHDYHLDYISEEFVKQELSEKITKEIMKAAGKAERAGIPKEAGIETASLAIGFINDIPTTKELIEGIIKEAEEILTVEGIGGWKLTK